VKQLSPALLALAVCALAPSLSALDVKDDNVKLGLFLQLQMRADVSSAETAAGADYDVMTGGANGGDAVDFYLRRVRFGLKGMWKDDYKFSVVFYGDKAQTGTQTIRLYEATIARAWKDEANGLTHEFKAGLANAFYNGALGSYSSTAYLFPGIRATELLGGSRGVGVAYMLTAPLGRFGVDVQNNTADDTSATASDGMFYSARLEATLPGELGIAKPTETFLGKDGKGALLAVDGMTNVRAGNATTTTAYGVELLGHYDAITALAEFRASTAKNNTTDVETKKQVWLVQAGYAMPLGDGIIEPALRYQAIDLDTDNEEEGTSYGTGLDYGTSGTQVDVGVNYYLHGVNNKVQVAYTMWQGEEDSAGDQASADILRAQWQLTF
jgi:hypothetical protein